MEWTDNAIYKDGSGKAFRDTDFHNWLKFQQQVPHKDDRAWPGEEWFKLDVSTSQRYFNIFAMRKLPDDKEQSTYILRKEQAESVEKTLAYFKANEKENKDDPDWEGDEFLWNAKPRFGKTLTAYDLIQKAGYSKVLIVSNRPAISNSWVDDFNKFVRWKNEYTFVSDTEALLNKPGVYTRAKLPSSARKIIAFESLQGLKGSSYFGGDINKLKWIYELEFDLLIVDESHEGVDTAKTERAFDSIKRKHTLYLSGTPFKQLASDDFKDNQIFNWSYADEQEAKREWQGSGTNPYENLPRLNLFTYQLSEMIRDKAQRGIDLGGEEGVVNYAFDLNEFFSVKENGRFVYEEDVRRFLRALSTQEKYPFSTPELRDELAHTMWYLNRVASAKALAKLLEEDEVFKEYKVVLAVGDAKNEDMPNLKAIDQVKKAIRENSKTITLTVGQLTVGITVPEWTGVLMLCNMNSEAAYMQAAFRAQNPGMKFNEGKYYQKEDAYVFDFDPARTLIIFDKFANNLSTDTASGGGTSDDRKENIKRLLNFLPVLGEDTEGRMVELDAAQILSIPRKLKSQEVVRRGFMSNFLFQNVGRIFNMPEVFKEILEQLPMAEEEKRKPDQNRLDKMSEVKVDDNGEIEIDESVVIGSAQGVFGEKVYEVIEEVTEKTDDVIKSDDEDEIAKKAKDVADILKKEAADKLVSAIAENMHLKKSTRNKIEKQVKDDIDRNMDKLAGDYRQAENIAKANMEHEHQNAATEVEREQATKKYEEAVEKAKNDFTAGVQEKVRQILEEKPKEIIREVETAKAVEEKNVVEDEMRAHLRGFARTIPSFLMAYGDDDLRLDNFDTYVDEKVFFEVTNITLDQFRIMRGDEYPDKETGEIRQFKGGLFDKVVFNDSIKEFLSKKRELANYFDESQEEDIFDYIPPQKTNQIFTPRWVVEMMLDKLEEENPGCFDDPNKTFADLYMKSGLYVTEIVKRLFKSDALKQAFPDDGDRIRHILEKQVYGIAPSEIIYRIATNFILGFDDSLKAVNHNFIQKDTVQYAKEGKLSKLVDEEFGE